MIPSRSRRAARSRQDRFDTRRPADRLHEELGRSRFTPEDRAFIESRWLFFLATSDNDGQPDCFYKGGDPGFVRVTADDELAFPGYDGNGMFRSLGNVLAHPAVALLIARVRAERFFPDCTRYIHRVTIAELSPYVPQPSYTPPVPKWKTFDSFRDVPPRGDPAGGDRKISQPAIPRDDSRRFRPWCRCEVRLPCGLPFGPVARR